MKNTVSRILSIAMILSLALLVGCGGGGGASGGGSGSAILTINTDWTNHASPGGGLSEQLDLRDGNGLLVQELNVNQDVAGQMTTAFNSVPAGNYHLTGQLWSLRDIGGVQTGSFDRFVSLNSSASLRIDVGNSAASVAVTPPTATFTVQNSQQFYATPLDAGGNVVFGPSGSIAWTELGGVVSIDAVTGIATGTNPGTGSVRATYSGSLIGGATVTVTPFTVTTSKWTVLVYMNAANDLDAFSTENMIQMQKVAGVPANVRFIVQWKQAAVAGQHPTFIGTRRYQVVGSSSNQMVSHVLQDLGTGVDMGNAQTMSDFINWGKTFFPATRYCVIVWNHGNGWAPGLAGREHRRDMPTRGFSYDDDTGNHIETWQLGQALGTVQPDILAWDASLMQMVEVAYEARNQARFVVGSEESPPAAGYPYDLVFAPFRDTPDDTTLNLSKSFVDGMMTAYGASNTPITQSVIDTTQLPALATATSGLADALIANKASLTTLVPFVRSTAQKYDDFGPPLNRLYRDLFDVCTILQNGGGGNPPAPLAVTNAAQTLQTAITNAVLYNRHTAESANSHGVSIDFSQSTDFLANKFTDYQQLSFGSDSNIHWINWLTQAP